MSVDPKRVYVTSPEAAPKGKYVRYSVISGHSCYNLLSLNLCSFSSVAP